MQQLNETLKTFVTAIARAALLVVVLLATDQTIAAVTNESPIFRITIERN